MKKKMGTILGILGGIIALAIIIFKGMDSTGPIPIDEDVSKPIVDTNSDNSPSTNSNTDNNTYTPPNVGERWLCIPYKRVGVVEASFSEEDLKRVCGNANVVRKEVGREWGETIPATILYPDSTYPITVEWKDGYAYQTIDKVRIEGDSTKWQTQEGIHIGSTLSDLLAINGRNFEFYGFEWDYSGKVANWQNGKVNKGITIYLVPENPAAVFPAMLGDSVFSTTHPKALEAELRVGVMEIDMN